MKLLNSFGDLVPRIAPGARIVLHSAFSEPGRLASGLALHADALSDVSVLALMPMGKAPYAGAGGGLRIRTFFPGKGLRQAVNDGRAELTRTPLSEVPRHVPPVQEPGASFLFLQVSPPDEHGVMSLGITVDYMRHVLRQRPVVVAEINRHMPATAGDTRIGAEEIDYVMEAFDAPETASAESGDAIDLRIAQNIAGLVASGDAIQIGIGSIPDLVAGQLGHLHDLGVHTGIITEALMPLIEQGVVTNSRKRAFKERSVATMAGGSPRFYAFLHRNSAVEFHPSTVTHGAETLDAIENLCAINSVLEVDLTGRANAERKDGRILSAPGGLPDFAAAAARSPTGKSILALRSTSAQGSRSNIRAPGQAMDIVTLDGDAIDYLVTEHGVARLSGLDARARARALAGVSDPAFRTELTRAAEAM